MYVEGKKEGEALLYCVPKPGPSSMRMPMPPGARKTSMWPVSVFVFGGLRGGHPSAIIIISKYYVSTPRLHMHSTNPITTTTTPRHTARTGLEVAARVLGRDAALHRVAARLDLVLEEAQVLQRGARGEADLGLFLVDFGVFVCVLDRGGVVGK